MAEHIKAARALIAAREAEAGIVITRGGRQHVINDDFALGALDPVLGWSAALDALEAERKLSRAQAKVQDELRETLLAQRDAALGSRTP